MDKDETHEEYRPSHGLNTHPWDITYTDDEGENTYYVYTGTQKGVNVEMQRILDDNFDGGMTSEGYYPGIPELIAYCEPCGITYTLTEGVMK